MIALLQRVELASVKISGEDIASIGPGLLVLLGIGHEDTRLDAEYLAIKTREIRIFNDGDGKMNLNVEETGGEILVVSQFTLLGNCRKGRRPSFVEAASPDAAKELYDHFIDCLRLGDTVVGTGIFGAMMKISLVNDGPVTLILKSKEHESRY